MASNMLARAAKESGRWGMSSMSMADVRGSHTTVAFASTHMPKARTLGPTTCTVTTIIMIINSSNNHNSSASSS